MSHCDPQHGPKLTAKGLKPMNAQESIGTMKTPADLPAYWREHYEERAAIREYEGGQSRDQAEAEALRETIDLMKAAGEQGTPAHSSTPIGTPPPSAYDRTRTPGEPCPECGNRLVPESGCWFCPSCGFSKCG